MNTLLLMVLLSTNGVNLSWTSVLGTHYELITTTTLAPSISWTPVTNMIGTGNKLSVDVAQNLTRKYYQMVARTHRFEGKKLYHETNTPAATSVKSLASSSPQDALLLKKIADQPTSVWVTSSSSVSRIGSTFSKCGTNLPTFVLYYIYQRDNTGGFSQGGAATPLAYTNFINSCKTALRAKESIVVLEPDALPGLGGLAATNQTIRFDLIKYAVDQLSSLPTVHLYIDSGHSNWEPASTMATRLKRVGIEKAAGFALNVSNYRPTSEIVAYGNSISTLVGKKHFVIDTSRNGKLVSGWCNVAGAGLGAAPTLNTSIATLDAKLYVKYPGESDGTCNGGPNAGQWFLDYAVMLCTNAVQ